MPFSQIVRNKRDRRSFVGGSDARIIMGSDEAALIRLWREKRGEAEPEDLSGNLIVQLGPCDRGPQPRTGTNAIPGRQVRMTSSIGCRHPVLRWMGATLDGIVDGSGAVFEAKFMLPWSFSEEAAAEKHMAQLQHNMWVTNARAAALSMITGGGKWVEITISGDPLYQHLLLTAEKKFWRCVENGEPPRLFGAEPPRPRIEAIRIVDMSSSNSWAEFAAALPQHARGLSRSRAGERRAQGPDAGGRQGGHRAWRTSQALEIGRRELRRPGTEATHAPIQ